MLSNITVLEAKNIYASGFPDAVCEDQVRVLLVEDVQSDAVLLRRALDGTHVPYALSRIRRGDEALTRLRRCQKFHPDSLPDLILLDLGLPGMDGFEILDEIAAMPAAVRSIPIAVLTAHKHFDYIQNNYPLSIIAYLNKPCYAAQMETVLGKIRKLKNNTPTRC